LNSDKGDKLYYSIGEVAEHLGVNPSLIRYWEKEFPNINPRKNRRGERSFTEEEIRKLERIHQLVKGEGYTLKGAKKRMREKGDELERTQELLQHLKQLRQELMDWKRSLSEGGKKDQ
jgi:DNA-binding transcriptional MerR regulator